MNMKRVLAHSLLGLYLFFITPLARGEFNLYHLTDTHCSASERAEVKQVVGAINAAADADVVVVTGDVVEIGATAYYEGFKRQLADALSSPLKLYVCGNHETVWSGVGGKYLFAAHAGPLNWYHDIEKWRIVSLNNAQADSHGAYLGVNDLAWLKGVLAEAKEKGLSVIVCSHFPPTGPGHYSSLAYDEDRLFTLFKEHNVKLYLCGHQHQNNSWTFCGVPVMNLAATKSGWYTRYAIDGQGVKYQVYEKGTLRNSGTLYDAKGVLAGSLRDFSGRGKCAAPGAGTPKVMRGEASVRKLYQAAGSCQAGAAAVGGSLAFADSSGKGYKLEARSGKLLGETGLRGEGSLQPIAYKGDFIYFSDHGDVKGKGWQAKIVGGISSQPVLFADKLVLGTALGKIKYLDAASGRELAEYDAGGFPLGGFAVDGGRLYFASFSGDIGCLDARGAKVWHRTTGGVYYSMAPAVPAVAEKVVVFGGREDGTLYAFWKDDGGKAWDADLALGNINVCDIHAYGDFILVTGLREPGNLRALRAADGVIEWEAPLPFYASRTSLNGAYLALAGGNAARLGVFDLETRTMLVDVDLGDDLITGAPLLAGDTLYQSTLEGQLFAVQCPAVKAGKKGSAASRRTGGVAATRAQLAARPLDDFEKGVSGKWAASCDSYGESSIEGPEAVKAKGLDGKQTTVLRARGFIGKSAEGNWVWMSIQMTGAGDVSKSVGISFIARSEKNNLVYMAVEGILGGKDVSGTGAGPRCSFQLGKEWKEYVFRWADFKQPSWACPGENCLGAWVPDNVSAFTWAPLDEGKEFDLWLDDVKLIYEK